MIKYHSFDVELASKIGVNEAIITGYVAYWVYQNRLNNKNLFKSRFWTFNTSEAIAKHFPYFTAGQIKNLLLKLEKDGILISDNFNKNKFDRTKWYSLADKYLYLIDETKSDNNNGVHENDNPLTDLNNPLHENDNGVHENDNLLNIKPIANSISNTVSNLREGVCENRNASSPPQKNPSSKISKFKKPSLEEIKAYIEQKGFSINAEAFYDHYESNGWIVGKTKMKNWQSTINNWQRRETDFKSQTPTFKERDRQNFLGEMEAFLNSGNDTDTIEAEILR